MPIFIPVRVLTVFFTWVTYFTSCGLFDSVFAASTIEWKADDIKIFLNSNSRGNSVVLNVTAQANGQIFRDDFEGHFHLQYSFMVDSRTEHRGITKCISLTGDSISSIRTKLLWSSPVSSSSLSASQIFGKYFSVVVQKFYNDHGSSKKSTTSLVFTIVKQSGNTSGLSFDISMTNCSFPQTYGRWSDTNNWIGGKVPSISDSVVIPTNAGVIQLNEDIHIRSIHIFGGSLRAYDTGCPTAWTIDDRALHTDKCFKFIDQPMTFNDARKTCNAIIGGGSLRRNLVQISDRNELDLIYRLCRPSKQGQGCWIGMTDSSGEGKFRWIVDDNLINSNVPNMFFDWRRGEPSNHTVSSNKESKGGERCVATVPWTEDALLEEQGGWNDDSCTTVKPFICQSIANTVKFRIILSSSLEADGGILEGGKLEIGQGITRIKTLSLHRGAEVTIPTFGNATIESMYMADGSKLTNGGALELNEGIIGEVASYGAQSLVYFGASSKVTCKGKVLVKAKVSGFGSIVVAKSSELRLSQGGMLSQASAHLVSVDSSLTFAGYASRLATWDSFELKLMHRGPFTGEFYGANALQEAANEYLMVSKGVYRLKVVFGLQVQVSSCIPYNATISEISSILNSIDLIKRRGGVSVRRYGDQHDPMFGYGFTYRIEVDSAETFHFVEGSLSLEFQCYGLSCGCADSKVDIFDTSGVSLCVNPSNYSNLEVNSCVIPPMVEIQRISTLSYLHTSGDGSIIVFDGSHRLMPVSTVGVVIQSGTGIAAASVIQWNSIDVSNIGNLVIAGTGWAGWDSSYLLFSPDWVDERGIVSALSRAPPANMSSHEFSVTDSGRVVTTGPGTTMFWSTGVWNGGIIGGQCDLYILDKINLAGAHKALRYGITVHISDEADARWTNGNISLANGARILVRGTFNVSNLDSKSKIAIGEAHLLSSALLATQKLMKIESGRSWQSYFDRVIAAELRPAWYVNPLCGSKCLLLNELYIEGNGQIIADSQSDSLFLLPLNIVGTSKFNVGKNAKVNLGSGGIFGNDVVVDLSIGTVLELSGGRMKMEATCTIKGAGELIVTAGSHDLSFSVDAHITISGGTLVWPESRGTQKTITFNGGLLIQGTGQLEVQPFSTTILVHEEVHLKDESIIQFPLIGIAAQASPFDRSDAPDTSPRGNLTATGTMRWEGGTLKGKADFNALKELFLDGAVKYIKSLAKLVNKGHCEWGNGDIITSDNGDFQNFGTIQMRDGVSDFHSSMMYKGSELPVDNGGDFFALEYHSWDTDNGALDYTEYLQLRTRFVSRVPNGWTFESQK